MPQRPRFGFRTVFVITALAALLAGAGWTCAQRDWIRQRHEFFEHHQCQHAPYDMLGSWPSAPWQLRMFGEKPERILGVRADRMEEARRLFPEAKVFADPYADAN